MMPSRDIPLDILRAGALVLMTSVHIGRRFPAQGQLIPALQFVGELAPVLFFFAYGMTFPRYAQRPLGERVAMSLELLALGVVHSLMLQGAPFTAEFFTFLAVSRVLLDVGVRSSPAGRRVLLAAASAAFLAWVLQPAATYHRLSLSNPGWFPVIPWIGFVAAGYWFQRRRGAPQLPLVCAGAAALGLLIWAATGDAPSKWPLSPSYALIFAGATGLAVHALDRLHLVREPGAVAFLSRHLLLATVLHYLPFWAMSAAYGRLPAGDGSTLGPAALYLALSIAAVALLYGLLQALLWAVAWTDSTSACAVLRSAHPALCIVAIVGYGCLTSLSAALGSAPVTLVGFVIMVYMAVGMRRRGEEARAPGLTQATQATGS